MSYFDLTAFAVLPKKSKDYQRDNPIVGNCSITRGSIGRDVDVGGGFRDRQRQGCRCRAYREVFTACPGRQRPQPHCPGLLRSYYCWCTRYSRCARVTVTASHAFEDLSKMV